MQDDVIISYELEDEAATEHLGAQLAQVHKESNLPAHTDQSHQHVLPRLLFTTCSTGAAAAAGGTAW